MPETENNWYLKGEVNVGPPLGIGAFGWLLHD